MWKHWKGELGSERLPRYCNGLGKLIMLLAVHEQLEEIQDMGALPDLPVETREIEGAGYRGQIVPLFFPS